jgi:beta-N-acetylhexosaminidase
MKRLILFILLLTVIPSGCTKEKGDSTPSADPPPAEENPKSAVETLLEDMTLVEKAGQLFMVGIEGTQLDQDTALFLKENKIGGVILFGRNIESPGQVGRLTEKLQGLKAGPAGVGMLIATDQEGGRVNRLPGDEGRFPSAEALARDNNTDTVKDAAEKMAVQLKGMGINLNFAPVLDINSNPDNPVIGDRAFGSDPQTVSRMGMAFIQGTLDGGVVPAAKHFPGHGDTLVDSHTDLPVVSYSPKRLEGFELVPFSKAVKNGVPAIMSAHILIREIDSEYPATLSPAVINGILREKMGFDGVVVSDDLDMGAITGLYSHGEAAVRAINSGIDILLIGHGREGMAEALEAVQAAAKSGDIAPDTIDRAVMRILTLKEKFGLVDG